MKGVEKESALGYIAMTHHGNLCQNIIPFDMMTNHFLQESKKAKGLEKQKRKSDRYTPMTCHSV